MAYPEMSNPALQKIAGRIRRELFPSQVDKERKIIDGLPPVFLRLFGDIDYQEQLREIPEAFKGKVVVLTTCDTSDEIVEALRGNNWNVVKSDITEEQARVNSSLLLNEGLRFARDHHNPYAFFLASGFQKHLGIFYGAFYEAAKIHPYQDAYYFVLPETHADVRVQSHEQMNKENIDEFLLRGFPSETAVFIRTTMSSFETDLSAKGSLGFTDDGIPLGGMEFLCTLLAMCAQAKNEGSIFSPHMLALVFPTPTRSGLFAKEFYRRSHEVPASGLGEFDSPRSLEVTPNATKLARRISTWRAAMERLGLTEDDIRILFSQTKFDLGFLGIHSFLPKVTSMP